MSEPIFRFKSFLRSLAIIGSITVAGMYLHAQFDIPFYLMKEVIAGSLVAMIFFSFIYFYFIDRVLLKKKNSSKLKDDIELQQMEKKLEMLLEQAKKDEQAR